MSTTRRKNTVKEATQGEKLSAAVDAWFNGHIHGSPVSRSTEAYNHLVKTLPALKTGLETVLEGDSQAQTDNKEE